MTSILQNSSFKITEIETHRLVMPRIHNVSVCNKITPRIRHSWNLKTRIWKNFLYRNMPHTISRDELAITMEPVHDLEHSMKYFIAFGKVIGLYPSDFRIIRIVPLLLAGVVAVDLAGYLAQPVTQTYKTAADICATIGSPQFYFLGAFCYFYIQNYHKSLRKVYEKWKKIPILVQDTTLSMFINTTAGIIMTSAILENISFHFKLFPIFEPPVQNLTSFEVYYMRSHSFWAYIIPFTPYHATLLLIANKLALYAWNFSDILVIVTCRALRFRFEVLHQNIDVLGPVFAVKRHEDLTDLMRLLESYLSPLVFGCFYLDFYATCMQLHMWMTPSQHKHVLHTIYLLWSFVHLIVRVFLLTYQASRLYEASIRFHEIARVAINKSTSIQMTKQILRIDYSPRRPLAISGGKCFFITKRFLLTLIYVAFSFEIFLIQSDSIKCP